MKNSQNQIVRKFKELYTSNKKFIEFLRFVMVGTIATLLHYAIYYLLQKTINVNIAYTMGYLMSFISNFYLTSVFTFRVKPTWKKLGGLAGAHIVNYLMHIVFLNIFLVIGIKKTIAPIPVFSIVIPINFLLVRYVFKSRLL